MLTTAFKTEIDIYTLTEDINEKMVNYICHTFRRILKGYYAPPLAFEKTFQRNKITWRMVELHGSFTEFQVNMAIETLQESYDIPPKAIIRIKKIGENVSVLRIFISLN